MLIHEQLGIYKVKLPLPFKLNHVNCYAIKGKNGWWIIDTGLNTPADRQNWQEFMKRHNIEGIDIKGIYLTHYHPDHFGGAGWLQKLSGAPVYISSMDADAAQRYFVNSEQALEAVIWDFWQNGVPRDLTESLVREMSEIIPYTMPHPQLNLVTQGSKMQLGNYEYQTLKTPGHSDGHLCYYNEQYGVMFSGDHILPKITSNISLWPNGEPDPLNNFLCSLHANLSLNCKTVLPAHGEPFQNLEERINQLETHHQERLSLVQSLSARGATAYEVCQQAFSSELSQHEMRFAVSETLAHLMYLVYQGSLQVSQCNGVNVFSKPTTSL